MEPCYKTFVSIGNAKQHFKRLLDAVHVHIHLLPQPILIQRGHTPFESSICAVVDFINMDKFVDYVAKAEILILHAGAGSILHAMRNKKRPIVMPRCKKYFEHVNDHQVAFARAIHSEGKIILIENESELEFAIKKTSNSDPISCFEDAHSQGVDIIKNKIAQLMN